MALVFQLFFHFEKSFQGGIIIKELVFEILIFKKTCNMQFLPQVGLTDQELLSEESNADKCLTFLEDQKVNFLK